MPRYLFSWDNIPDAIVTALASAIGSEGDARTGLRATYGARPKQVFVQDLWPVLLDAWLPIDDDMRSWIVEELVAAGLGDLSIDVTAEIGQFQYLRTCRNASTLRIIVLSAFQTIGEPGYAPSLGSSTANSQTLEAETSTTSDTSVAPQKADAADPETQGEPPVDVTLVDWVIRSLSEAAGMEITRDTDGDIPIPRGSSVTYIRVDSENPVLHFFSFAVSKMPANPALYEAVNEINLQLELCKAIVIEDGTAVLFSATIPADSLSTKGLMYALDQVSATADHFDSLLVDRFGGTTMMLDEAGDVVDV